MNQENEKPKRGYQSKTVRRVIRKKIKEWLDTLPDTLTEEIQSDVIVTGGAIASLLIGEEVNDYDVYFKSKSAAAKIASYYCKQFIEEHPDLDRKPEVRISEEGRVAVFIKSAGVAGESSDEAQYEYFETVPSEDAAEEYLDQIEKEDESTDKKKKYRPVYLSENAISLSEKIQIVIRFYGDPNEIHENYDFDHCKCWYDYGTGELGTPTEALLSLMSRTLTYTGSLYPLCSLFRIRKFVSRGWNINAGEILKIGFQVSRLDLTNTAVLREQLVGVDMAYFTQLLNAIEDDKEERKGMPIDSTYICQLIDRIFNA